MRKINLRENRAYLETYTPGIPYHYDIIQISERGFLMRRLQKKATHIKKNSPLYDDHACPDFCLWGWFLLGEFWLTKSIYIATHIGHMHQTIEFVSNLRSWVMDFVRSSIRPIVNASKKTSETGVIVTQSVSFVYFYCFCLCASR